MAKIDPMYNLINTILNDREIVIFLGAGASMEGKQGVHRFPSFDELMDNVLKNFGIVPKTQKERRDSFLAIIEQWEKQNQLSVRLHNYLEGEPGLAHYYLTALSIALFSERNALLYLTTNYDDLVMNAFSDLKKNPERRFDIVPLSLSPNITGSEFIRITRNVEGHLKEGRPVIIKLFGDLNSQSPIFRQDDMKFEPEVERKLIEWMKKPMIVIGYSFSDKIMEELLIASRGVAPVFLVNPSKKIPNSIKTLERVQHIERGFFDFISSLLNIVKERNLSISEKFEKIIESRSLPPLKIEQPFEKDKPPMLLRRKTKTKILILASNPKDTSRIRFDEEIREIEDAINRSKNRDRFEIKTKVAVRLRDTRQALLDYEPQIVHFVGHGKNEGLMVEDVEGNCALISTEPLSELFELFSTQVECVVLNACFTEPQADAIKKSICYVIGMRRETRDEGAIEFAVGFYDALGAGKSIEDAFKFGRQAVLQEYPGFSEHLVPVLKKEKIENPIPGGVKPEGQKKSLFDYTVEELDREIIVRGAEIPTSDLFKFSDTVGTPERKDIMERVKTLYRSAPLKNKALDGFETEELARILLFKLGKLEIDGVRGIWNIEKRLDFYEVKDEHVRRNADSVAAICSKSDLIDSGNGYSTLKVKSYKEVFNLCDEEPFSDQCIVSGTICTGFLVKENIIATAYHFVADWDVTNLRFIFGYRMSSSFNSEIRVSNREIYKGKTIIDKAHDRDGNKTDWALVELDRIVEGKEIVALSEESVYCNQPVYAIGYPCGLPLKYAPGVSALTVHDAYFSAHLDIYSGNSGSPVFDSKTHKVIGMVVRGDSIDFRWMGIGKGMVSVIYPNTNFFSQGSECTRVSEFIGALEKLK